MGTMLHVLGEESRARTGFCCVAVCTWLGMMAWEQCALVVFSFKTPSIIKSASTHDLRGYISDYAFDSASSRGLTRFLSDSNLKLGNQAFLISITSFRFLPRGVVEFSLFIYSNSKSVYRHSPRNRDLPAFPARAHIPSNAFTACHRSYHDAASSGAIMSMVIEHCPVAI